MNRVVLLAVGAFMAGGGIDAASAQNRSYAGRVTQIYPREGRAEVRRGGNSFWLRRGDSVFEGDCVRSVRAGTAVTVRQDDNSVATIAFAGDQCTPIHTRNEASDRVWRYVVAVLEPLKRRPTSPRVHGSNRGADVTIVGLNDRAARPIIRAGARSLTLVWCLPNRLRFVVRGPGQQPPRYQNARDLNGAVQLESIDFTPGTWTIDIYPLAGERLDSVDIEVVAELPAQTVASGSQAIASLAALERAGNLARSDPQGRLDFEAVQTGVEDFNVRDRTEVAQVLFCRS